jgi:glycosyltransferase involved in cell wall biosynthesis
MRRLRVAQIVGTGDGARWIADICEGLRSRGYDACAIVSAPDGSLVDRLTSLGIPVHSTRLDPRLRLGTPLRLAASAFFLLVLGIRLAWLLRRERIDVAQSHIWWSILVGRVGSWIARTPIRLSHVPGPYHLESSTLRRIDLMTQWMDHRLIAGSQFIDSAYASAGVPEQRRRCIHYGADPARFDPTVTDRSSFRRDLGIEADAPLVGQVAFFYGRVQSRFGPPHLRGRGIKGQEDFIDAARLVLDEVPSARFVLVGGGWGVEGEEEKRAVEGRAAALGLGQAVLFTGTRSDIPQVLSALDVSVQCSHSENLGGTIESLLMEVPTIATRVGGMPESVRHEETGLLVPPRDPEALAEAILQMLRAPEWAKELARAGRKLMLERFTIQRTVADLDALYSELARERGLVPEARPLFAESASPS